MEPNPYLRALTWITVAGVVLAVIGLIASSTAEASSFSRGAGAGGVALAAFAFGIAILTGVGALIVGGITWKPREPRPSKPPVV